MRVAIIHNFGEHPGGGDLVMLNIVEALVEHGYEVTLFTSRPGGLEEAIKHFEENRTILNKVQVEHVRVPNVPHPYNIYLMSKKLGAKQILDKYDLIIVSDDIPKPLSRSRVLVYIHYPHAARIILNELVPYRYKHNLRGKIIWKAHSLLFKQCFLTNWSIPNIVAVANSTLTYEHISKALRPIHSAKIYPSVQVKQIDEYLKKYDMTRKEDLVVYVGRIQPEKGIEDIIKALAHVDSCVRAVIMGFLFDEKYPRHLINLARSLGVEKHVEIIPNASRETILENLVRAKILIHPAHYEPFGIAVVEGMAAGCIPIVRKGFNGPWIDIIEQGRYGYGFNTAKELANTINIAIRAYSENNAKTIISRALEFDEEVFKNRFIEIVQGLKP